MAAHAIPTNDQAAIAAQAHMLHAYFLGLQLMISSRKGPEVMGDWMFRLFRRQHEDKFLSSFNKLGLDGLPHAVACARYHVLSNSIGGVPVEYHETSDRQAWVRFRYPRWMYHGPTICGIPVEVSRGFLNGWYAHNGVSLGNPRLGYVCVSEDMTGEYGLCGYFQEYDRDLKPEERLRFAKDEAPPTFDPNAQLTPPAEHWSEERLAKANRNYALDYVRNGLGELVRVFDEAEVMELSQLAARLIGLQYYAETAAMVGAPDGDTASAVSYLASMFAGMGDPVEADPAGMIHQQQVRALRGLQGAERERLTAIWIALWQGTLSAQRQRKRLTAQAEGEGLRWQIEPV